MQKQTAVIEQISVTNKGEWKYFQIRIPKDAQAIIGIETGIRLGANIPALVPPATIVQSLAAVAPRIAGEIRLQQIGSKGILYSGRVMESDHSPCMADVGALDFFPAHSWSHQSKNHEDDIRLHPNSQVMTGSYHDMLGERLGINIPYTVTLCVWYERKEEQV